MAVRGLCSLDDVATGEASRLFGFARVCPDDTPTTRDLLNATSMSVDDTLECLLTEVALAIRDL